MGQADTYRESQYELRKVGSGKGTMGNHWTDFSTDIL